MRLDEQKTEKWTLTNTKKIITYFLNENNLKWKYKNFFLNRSNFFVMDYIREFDIRLDKEHYYAGETLNGVVVLDTIENFKLRCKSIFSHYSLIKKSIQLNVWR